MRFPALALLLLLTGCSLPSWMGGPGNAPSTSTPTSNGQPVGQAADDLGSCQEQARAVLKRDEAIDQDINNQSTSTNLNQGMGDLNNNLSAYNSKNRYERMVDDCMRARGYDAQNPNVKPVQVEQQGGAASTPATAPELTPAPPSAINPNLPTYP